MIKFLSILLISIVVTSPNCLLAAGDDCMGLVYALMGCHEYKCVSRLGGKQVKYEVLGISGEYCKYSERDESGFVLCRVSKENFGRVSDYLVQIFTRNVNILQGPIARLKAETCSFYRIRGNSFIKKDRELDNVDVREIERVIEMRVRKEEAGEINSIFFSEEDLKKLEQ